MSIFDTLLSRFGYFKTQTVTNPAQWLLADAETERFNIPNPAQFSAQSELMARLSWVNIAVTTISRAAAMQAISVKQVDGEDTEDIVNHEFEMLLHEPNPLQSRFEFLESFFSFYALTGNGYIWLNKSSEAEPPSEMWIIPTNKIEPVPDSRMYLKGYKYENGGQQIALEPWEIVHLKRWHPLNPWVGLSPIEAIAMTAAGDLGMSKYNTQLFTVSNARLPGILAFASNINDTEWERMKVDVTDKSQKRQLMMLRNVGPQGVSWIQAAATQKDMEYLNGRRFNRQEIFDIFAPGLYAMLSENATEANARTAKATFTELALWPILTSASEKFTNDLLPSYGEDLVCEFEDPRVTDRAMELQEQAAAEKVLTVDEIRAQFYDLPPIAEISKEPEDKRGVMLIAQINASTPIGEEPEPEPPVMPIPEQLPEQPGETVGQNEPNEEQEAEEPEDMPSEMEADVKRWQRKALNAWKRGESPVVKFESVTIPPEFREAITARLQDARTPEQIRAAFDYSGAVKPDSDYSMLVLQMKRLADFLEATDAT